MTRVYVILVPAVDVEMVEFLEMETARLSEE